ncbi:MAG TPA: hypothetical protein VMO20_02855, partial [Candidatus Acidoferrum sp.]|nr:hypothetical protein [Candidatus Acidoferrum sp.]
MAAARAAAIVFRTTEKYSSLARYKVRPVIVPVKDDFFRTPGHLQHSIHAGTKDRSEYFTKPSARRQSEGLQEIRWHGYWQVSETALH